MVCLSGALAIIAGVPAWAGEARTIKPSRVVLRDDRFCLGCHAPGSLAKGAKPADSRMIYGSAHADLACVDCHRDVTDVPHGKRPSSVACAICHTEGAPPPRAAGHTAPGRGDLHTLHRPKAGETMPQCVACHGSHDTALVTSDHSLLAPAHVAATCGACHAAEGRQYSESVHGVPARAGNRDVPTCATCHPEHASLGKRSVAQRGVVTTCVGCHDDPGLQQRYIIAGNRLASYLGSYHGAATELGDNRTANCASCHGVHDILPSSDPRSTVNPRNMPLTCGQCHPGASEMFSGGRVHLQPSLKQDRLVFFARVGYQVFIGGLMSSFLGYIALDLIARRRRRFPGSKRAALSGAETEYERLTLNQRIQHWLLIASFLTLMISGIPLAAPTSPLSRGVVGLLGGMGARATIHRAAAIVLIGIVGYHLLYVLFSQRGYREFRELVPGIQDGRDLLRMLRFYFGLSTVPSRFGRYNYIEKFEYLAVGWGSVIMIGTGILLWSPGLSMSLAPKWVMDVALVVHGWEAIMAFLAIIIWHMYNVHLNPSVFPMSRIWLTGRISFHELLENHPLEYDRLMLRGALTTREDSP